MPTQALLDALTIKRRKGRIAGLTVAICGDIAHSRVAPTSISTFLRPWALASGWSDRPPWCLRRPPFGAPKYFTTWRRLWKAPTSS